ncbi:hypothetical protein Q73_07770 [Bacillus coahuilensis m2-6]|uniref:Uncharacterized protein n=1 Tax=Bacillus coahuilensis p1.1.43 TaxID=1150625 RepID=A0A147K8Q0_9BACI|nr:hypothetical protein [Bacillus coahuilensis]KUP06507.1 hypothetical protein Q75_08250 [Bacillus coahuilensis p1.1.43]KUP07992.1 hypothetical protein Q73_07770 [Bacillus coahuilensis m2-6]
MEEMKKVYTYSDGRIMNIETSNGRIISYKKAIYETQAGSLSPGNVEFHSSIMPFEHHSSL